MIVKTINRVVENITKENKYRQLYCDVAKGVIEYRSKSCEKYYLDIPRSRVEQWVAQNSKDEVKVVFTPANLQEYKTVGEQVVRTRYGLISEIGNEREVNVCLNTSTTINHIPSPELVDRMISNENSTL